MSARRRRRTPVLAATITLALLLLAAWRIDRWYGAQLQNEQRARATMDISLRSSSLTTSLNRRLSRLQGLHTFVQTEADSPNFSTQFETYAAGLFAGSYGVRNVAVARGDIVRYVYPLAGNETVLGYRPALDARPEVRMDVQRARVTREIVLTGPAELVQGGLGLIARQAVYRNGAYWGLVNIVLDVPLLLAEAGISNEGAGAGNGAGALQYALRNESGRIFFGPASLFDADPLLAEVNVGNEQWQLAAAPAAGWAAAIRPHLLVFRGAALVISLLLASLVYLIGDRQARLSQAVERRTAQLSETNALLQEDIAERRRAETRLAEREAQYRSVFESAMDALLIFDLEDGRMVDFNPAAHRLHGYTAEAFAQLSPADFIHPDYYHVLQEHIAGVRAGRSFRAHSVNVRRDGASFHVDVLGAPFTYRGRPHTLAVVRDISEQVEAYRLLEQRVAERTRELRILLNIGRSLTSTLELQPLVAQILEQLSTVVESTAAAVLMYDAEAQEMSVLTLHSRAEPLMLPERWPVRSGSLDDVIINARRPLIVDDVHGPSAHAALWRAGAAELTEAQPTTMRCWMGVPLLLKECVVGLLMFGHQEPGFYTSQHADLALAFGNQAAVAIENARLYEQARSLAALQERQRLARELHDSVSQALYGIALGARTAHTLLDRADLTAEQRATLTSPMEYVLSLAEAALTEMRALIFELRPESLAVEGLLAALARHADSLQARHALHVDTHFTGEPDVPLATKEALYRVTQEALHNVVKHAAAGHVSLSLYAEQDHLLLIVEDDGRGFDNNGAVDGGQGAGAGGNGVRVAADRAFPGHLGLRTMRERAEGIGAAFSVRSAPGQGTRVELRLPLGSAGIEIPG